MALMDDKKGLSNPVAKQQGYPTSGLMAANQGQTPPQLQQGAYQHQAGGGGLGGKAMQGSLWKTQAAPMSGGVASYVSIPTNIPPPGGGAGGMSFAAPGGMPNYGAKGGALGEGQPATGQKLAPLQPGAFGPGGQGGAGGAKFQPGGPAWSPLADIDAMRHQFDRGSVYDLQARRAQADQFADASRAAQAREAFGGRGLGVGGVERQYSYQRGLGDYEGQRAMMESQAQQQAFNNQMAYAQMVNDTKLKLIATGKELGVTITDQAYNQVAAELIATTGQTPTESQILAAVEAAGGTPTKTSGETKSAQISKLLDGWGWNKEELAVDEFVKMTNAEVIAFKEKWPNTWQRLLDETHGANNKKVVKKAMEAGLVV